MVPDPSGPGAGEAGIRHVEGGALPADPRGRHAHGVLRVVTAAVATSGMPSTAVAFHQDGSAAKLRLRGAAGREEAQRTVQRITGELAGLAERAAADAERLLTNAEQSINRRAAAAAGTAPPARRGR